MFNYDLLKRRYTAYWNRENHDRPLICACAPAERLLPDIAPPASIAERWENVEYVIESARRGIENTYYGGEAVPVFNPNLGPDILGAIAGCGLEYGRDTSWAVHCVKDWGTHPALIFDENNRWWKKIEELTNAAVEDSRGDYLVGITDLHPGTDGLVSLRGPEALCYDLIDCAEHINPRIHQMFDIYKEVLTRLEAIISPKQEGSTNWMEVWHPNERWYVAGSDFSCMISEDAFEEYVVPGLLGELKFNGNSIYHLDGPGALRHVDRILELPGVNGIQWVYGAGQPSARHWVELLKKIQNAGKLIHIQCEPDDVEPLCSELNPEGVLLKIDDCKNREEVERLVSLAEKASKRRKSL